MQDAVSLVAGHKLPQTTASASASDTASASASYSASASKDLTATSIGFAWKPATQVVFKGDYQIHETGSNSGINQMNFVVGWLY